MIITWQGPSCDTRDSIASQVDELNVCCQSQIVADD